MLVDGLGSDSQGLIERNHRTSLSAAKSARRTAERLLVLYPDYNDAWLAIGVEYYMLSMKPLPLRWILQLTGSQTDRDSGPVPNPSLTVRAAQLVPCEVLVRSLNPSRAWCRKT